jgi:hypothetical protein
MEVSLATPGAPAYPDTRLRLRPRLTWLGMKIVLATCLGILAFGPMSAGAATAPASGDRVTFGIEPVPTGGTVRPNFSFSATPGAVVNDMVAAVNYSSEPLSLQVYATDAVETTAGGFGLLPAGQQPTGVGSWIALAPGDASVQVPAETVNGPGGVLIPFVVHVPENATPGDHVGGIVASLQTTSSNTTGQRIILNQRIGTRVFLRVAGPVAPQLTVTGLHAVYEGTANPAGKGEVRISYLVKNTGNVDLGVGQSVAVSGLVGDNQRAQLAKVPLLLAGASVPESVVVSGVWPQLLLHATVTAAPVAVAGTSVTGLAPASASTAVWAIPWTLLALIALAVLVIIWALRIRKRRGGKRRAPTSRTASAPLAENLDQPVEANV